MLHRYNLDYKFRELMGGRDTVGPPQRLVISVVTYVYSVYSRLVDSVIRTAVPYAAYSCSTVPDGGAHLSVRDSSTVPD